jgi:hypothetical protein
VLRVLLVLLHLTLAAVWLGSMAYSLVVVQPRVRRFFPEEEGREKFLLALAHGNRWPVVGLVAMLIATAAGVMATASRLRVVIGYAVGVALYMTAAGIFADVSWRHWPARVFALPAELASFRRGLMIRAWVMLCLVGAAFVTALSVSVRSGL